jgi:hypothetical protein
VGKGEEVVLQGSTNTHRAINHCVAEHNLTPMVAMQTGPTVTLRKRKHLREAQDH